MMLLFLIILSYSRDIIASPPTNTPYYQAENIGNRLAIISENLFEQIKALPNLPWDLQILLLNTPLLSENQFQGFSQALSGRNNMIQQYRQPEAAQQTPDSEALRLFDQNLRMHPTATVQNQAPEMNVRNTEPVQIGIRVAETQSKRRRLTHSQLTDDEIVGRAKAGNLNNMEIRELLKENEGLHVRDLIFKSGNLPLAKICQQLSNLVPTQETLSNAIQSGNLEMVKYLFTFENTEPSLQHIQYAAVGENIEILKTVLEHPSITHLETQRLYNLLYDDPAQIKLLIESSIKLPNKPMLEYLFSLNDGSIKLDKDSLYLAYLPPKESVFRLILKKAEDDGIKEYQEDFLLRIIEKNPEHLNSAMHRLIQPFTDHRILVAAMDDLTRFLKLLKFYTGDKQRLIDAARFKPEIMEHLKKKFRIS